MLAKAVLPVAVPTMVPVNFVSGIGFARNISYGWVCGIADGWRRFILCAVLQYCLVSLIAP